MIPSVLSSLSMPGSPSSKAVVGKRITTARNACGMTQAQLADLIDVSERSVQDYEAGKTMPWKKLREIAGVLAVEVDWLLHGTRPDVPDLLDQILRRLERIEEKLDRAGE